MSTSRQLLSLIKPRIAALLCVTGVTASFAAGGLGPLDLAAFALAGVGMAGGAAALNCYYDRDIDPLMERTADRPLARGELDPRVALAFGIGLLLAATGVALLRLPPVSVGYMWLGVASYVGLYTVGLKRRHWLGVVLGGSAGSFPVLAGWSAVRPVALPAVVMAALVFVWTPAHAWALAIVYRDDFEAASIPTLPVVTSRERTRRGIWVSAVATVATAALVLPAAGPVYAGAFLPAATLFLMIYARYVQRGGDRQAVRAFFTSNVFLATLFVGWGLTGVTGGPVATVGVALATGLLFAKTWAMGPQLAGVRATPGPDWIGAANRAYRRLRLASTGS